MDIDGVIISNLLFVISIRINDGFFSFFQMYSILNEVSLILEHYVVVKLFRLYDVCMYGKENVYFKLSRQYTRS